MKICQRRLGLCRRYVLLLTLLTLLFILLFCMKEPNTQPSRFQSIENNGKRSQKTLLKATPGLTVARDKETASIRREGLGLQNLDSEAPRGKGEKKATLRTAPGRPQGKTEPAAKKLVPESLGKILIASEALLTRLRESLTAREAVPTKEKVAQATPTPPSLVHPTTQRSQSLKASNFKSEPQWDFEERYSLDVGGLQTTCPDSVKVRASKSQWLRDLFLPNLTLFLDSGHFTQSKWNRLEHFIPPFGFMELNQSLVQKVVTSFPPVSQQQLLLASRASGDSSCITCAVVGNGGILNGSHVGREIDGHDYVFRLNGAVIKGHEQDVGTRTSFYGFTAFTLVYSIYKLGPQGFQHVPLGKDIRYLHFLEGSRDYEWLEAMLLNQTTANTKLPWLRRRPQEAFLEDLNLDRYLLLHPDFLRYVKNRFLRSKTLNTAWWRIYRPTTGALLLFTALHLCDKVSAYGFITQGHERFSDHYYDKSRQNLIFYINHDFQLERTVWKRLHDEGIIWLYQRPQGAKAETGPE